MHQPNDDFARYAIAAKAKLLVGSIYPRQQIGYLLPIRDQHARRIRPSIGAITKSHVIFGDGDAGVVRDFSKSNDPTKEPAFSRPGILDFVHSPASHARADSNMARGPGRTSRNWPGVSVVEKPCVSRCRSRRRGGSETVARLPVHWRTAQRRAHARRGRMIPIMMMGRDRTQQATPDLLYGVAARRDKRGSKLPLGKNGKSVRKPPPASAPC
jgi:hypothetical protein